MSDVPNHYQRLGVEPGASLDEIKRAYRRLIRQHHPDRYQAESDRLRAAGDLQAAARMERQINQALKTTQELNIAYNVLTNPDKRARYDRALVEAATQAVHDDMDDHPEAYDERFYYRDRPPQAERVRHEQPLRGDRVPWRMFSFFIVLIIVGLGFINALFSPSDAPRTDIVVTSPLFHTMTPRPSPTPTRDPVASVISWRRSGDRFYDEGNYTVAILFYGRILEEQPDAFEVYYRRAQAYHARWQAEDDPADRRAALDDLSVYATQTGGQLPSEAQALRDALRAGRPSTQ